MRRMLNTRLWLLALALVVGTGATPRVASAYWTSSGSGSGTASLATLSAPTITGATPGAETVELSWSAVAAPAEGVVEYYVTRDGGAPSAGCPSSSSHSTVTSCTDTAVSIGAHKYRVTAVWRSWTATGAEQTATVTFGTATHLQLEASSTTPAAGEADNLTITAKDASNNTVGTYSGSHTLVFEGAAEAPGGTKPAVIDKSSVKKNFGEATEITFTEGKATVSGGKNGQMRLYKAEATHITVKEGSLNNGTGLAVTVKAAATKKFTLSAPGEQIAGIAFNVTLTASDEYGNATTGYAGAKTLAWSGPLNSPSGHAPAYPATATTVTFTNGVGTASEIDLYDAVATVTLTVKEGAVLKGSASLAIKATTAKKLTFAALAEQVAGTAFNVTLTASDEYGNTATGYAGVKTLAWSGPLNSPNGHAPEYPVTATMVTFASGVGKATSLKLYNAGSTTLTAKEGSTVEGSSSSFNVKAGVVKHLAWSEPRTEPAGKITSALCLFECAAEGLGKEGKFEFKVSITDEWGNPQSSHGAGSKTVKLTSSCGGCSLTAATLTIAEGVATSTEVTFTGAANETWQGTLEATEGALKATASLKH